MFQNCKIPKTSDNLYVYLLKDCRFERIVPKPIKQVLLKLLTTIASEAICESYGSVMETYHDRFKNSDLEDGQAQKEIFIRHVGPGLAKADILIQKTLNELNKSFVLSSRAKFSNISKVLKRKLESVYDFTYLDIFLSSSS